MIFSLVNTILHVLIEIAITEISNSGIEFYLANEFTGAGNDVWIEMETYF